MKILMPIFLMILGVACLAIAVFTDIHLMNASPHFPDVNSGRVYEHNVHGFHVYISHAEFLIVWISRVVAFLSILAFIIIQRFVFRK